jgi:hypothetical protein
MGPCNRTETRSPSILTQKTNPSITGRTQRTTKIYIRTPQTQNHSTIKSPYMASFFFIKKKDGKLQPVQDYCPVNQWTIWNKYPLPLIPQLVD